MQVVDRTSETTSAGASQAAAARGNVHSFQDLEQAQAAPLSRDKFLGKLPQTVIKWVVGGWLKSGRLGLRRVRSADSVARRAQGGRGHRGRPMEPLILGQLGVLG